MPEQEFSPVRSTASRKPWPDCPDIVIYRCARCSRLFHDLGGSGPEAGPVCCAVGMQRLAPLSCSQLPPGLSVDYAIVGGFNSNAVKIGWKSEKTGLRPEWILLRTFTGSYIKYPGPQKHPPLIFPLSDEDAYVYCDRPECERCVFRCKKGFIAYVFFASVGLVELPLDKISDYFKTRPT